jgi:hypothetical protein
MPEIAPTFISRRLIGFALGAALALAAVAVLAGTAAASRSQIAMFQDYRALSAPQATLQQIRALGASTVRVIVPWATIAPGPHRTRKPSFDATNLNAYPAINWQPYDQIDRDGAEDGITVDFTVSGGAPRWAEGSGIPSQNVDNEFDAWMPNATDYGQFVRAVGTRYDERFTPRGASSPLPAVRFWAIYNEPNSTA